MVPLTIQHQAATKKNFPWQQENLSIQKEMPQKIIFLRLDRISETIVSNKGLGLEIVCRRTNWPLLSP